MRMASSGLGGEIEEDPERHVHCALCRVQSAKRGNSGQKYLLNPVGLLGPRRNLFGGYIFVLGSNTIRVFHHVATYT